MTANVVVHRDGNCQFLTRISVVNSIDHLGIAADHLIMYADRHIKPLKTPDR